MTSKPAKRRTAAKKSASTSIRKLARKSTTKKPVTAITGVEQVPADKRDSELAEAWTRTITDPSLRYVHGVEAQKWLAKSNWPWRINVWVMELVRDEELQAELRKRIATAVRAVRGVTNVAEEDREVWVISGAPSGEALVRSVAEVVDELAERALAVIAQMR
jgi:hypothetical protein